MCWLNVLCVGGYGGVVIIVLIKVVLLLNCYVGNLFYVGCVLMCWFKGCVIGGVGLGLVMLCSGWMSVCCSVVGVRFGVVG